MGKCGNSMRNILERLCVYDLQGSQLTAELGAYEKGLGQILGEIEKTAAEAFIQTASREGLNRRERLFRPVNSGTDDGEKRALLLERNAQRGCFVPEMEQRLLAAGIRGSLIENHLGGIAVNVDSFIGVTPEQAHKDAVTLMPAHLPVYLESTGERWDAKDEKDLTFDSKDADNRSWDEEEC